MAHFGAKVTFFGSDKKRFQIEVSESAAKRASSDHELQSTRKGFKRFYSPKGRQLLEKQIAAEERKSNALRDISRRIFEKFSNK